MCDVLYGASDRVLPLIKYDEENPALWVGELGSFENYDKLVIKQFTLPYIYYIGAHTYCGCGFGKRRWRKEPNLVKRALNLIKSEQKQFSESTEPDYVLDAAANLTYQKLAHYLREVKGHGARLELFYAISGNQDQQPWRRDTIRIIDIESETFTFLLMQFYEVID
jgi:hypothetical protein